MSAACCAPPRSRTRAPAASAAKSPPPISPPSRMPQSSASSRNKPPSDYAAPPTANSAAPCGTSISSNGWTAWSPSAPITASPSRAVSRPRPRVCGSPARIGFSTHPMLDHFRFLRDHTSAVPKMTIPSPSVLHFRGGRRAVSPEVYPDMEGFYRDLGLAYRGAVQAFAGCRLPLPAARRSQPGLPVRSGAAPDAARARRRSGPPAGGLRRR